MTGGHCIDILALNVAASSVNSVSNLTILIQYLEIADGIEKENSDLGNFLHGHLVRLQISEARFTC